jgi:hypothetical protein
MYQLPEDGLHVRNVGKRIYETVSVNMSQMEVKQL